MNLINSVKPPNPKTENWDRQPHNAFNKLLWMLRHATICLPYPNLAQNSPRRNSRAACRWWYLHALRFCGGHRPLLRDIRQKWKGHISPVLCCFHTQLWESEDVIFFRRDILNNIDESPVVHQLPKYSDINRDSVSNCDLVYHLIMKRTQGSVQQ